MYVPRSAPNLRLSCLILAGAAMQVYLFSATLALIALGKPFYVIGATYAASMATKITVDHALMSGRRHEWDQLGKYYWNQWGDVLRLRFSFRLPFEI